MTPITPCFKVVLRAPQANNREQTTRDKTHHRQSSKAALGAMPGNTTASHLAHKEGFKHGQKRLKFLYISFFSLF
jgi:hypothetical protein